MKTILLALLSVATVSLEAFAFTPEGATNRSASPFAIPTFHCLGLYWSAPGGAADKEVLVRYRPRGAADWEDVLAMRYNPIPKTDNTIFRSDEWLPTGGLGGSRLVKHTMSRNNILHVRSSRDYSASANKQNTSNDFDYDLANGRIPPGQESHGVRGEPIYVPGAGYDIATGTGRFQLASDSPGVAAGQRIPNFSDTPAGKAPDIGACQRGAPPMKYGVRVGRP